MKIQKFIIELFKKIQSHECKSSRWQIAGAFIAGMIMTAALAQFYISVDVSLHRVIHKTIVPAPSDAPYFLKPDVYPNANPVSPGERHTSELVYACSRQEVIISG
jgi:hypothetical protein